jgi:hypothetical protein
VGDRVEAPFDGCRGDQERDVGGAGELYAHDGQAVDALARRGVWGLMPWVKSARKKRVTFGFSRLVRKPERRPERAVVVGAVGDGSGAAAGSRPRARRGLMPIKIRYAAPVHLTTLKSRIDWRSTATPTRQ